MKIFQIKVNFESTNARGTTTRRRQRTNMLRMCIKNKTNKFPTHQTGERAPHKLIATEGVCPGARNEGTKNL